MRMIKGFYYRRKKLRFVLVYLLFLLAFLICWSVLTVLILIAQDTLFGPVIKGSAATDEANWHRGVQVVVGHFNGNLPSEKRFNHTDEQLNANDFRPIDGAGENGRPVKLIDDDERLADATFGINQFNLIASDRIALNRSLPDVRRHQCKEKIYPDVADLPTTSVVIVYHNEAFSTLLRTVTSVIDRSPPQLLKEIILVDDASTREFLGDQLDRHLLELSVPVRVLRARSRVGLIRARMIGAAEASGDVLTFLDSHCECTIGWLEPLLARVKQDRKAVVCPIIDVINDRTFAYQKGIELFRGGFNWNLQFRWYSVPPEMAKRRSADPTSPIESPTMAGGLFSIDKNYFEELGAYDAGMDIWGGENLEFSFRIWQCGGRLEILPCSHVGHVFRKASPHDFPGKNSSKILNANLVRVAEVWMDEWKFLFYRTAPQALQIRKSVDVSDRIELRRRLHCKNFHWYLSNVWPEHFLPWPDSQFGRVVSAYALKSDQPACLHWSTPSEGGSKRASLHNCSTIIASGKMQQHQQWRFDRTEMWIFTKTGQLKGDEHQCLGATQDPYANGVWGIQLRECGGYDSEFWDYNPYRKSFTHRKSGLCLDQPDEPLNDRDSKTTKKPTLKRCTRGGLIQQWQLSPVKWLPDGFDLQGHEHEH